MAPRAFASSIPEKIQTKTIAFLPPATKLREGNVFTPVCHSIHRWGVSVRGVSVRGSGLCSRGISVWGLSVQRGLCPREGLSPGGALPGGSLSGRPPPYVNVRAVRILLECILVLHYFTTYSNFCFFLELIIHLSSRVQKNQLKIIYRNQYSYDLGVINSNMLSQHN